uniref:Uncharacterized protein n=1 Tax=Siphoviridae sp. ctQNW6 TaxID=2826328 RepID=A0A8S5QW73_9CAUD|nr:MAG TPA: hypothetical protein [Siphoviridae sp. ctQNW6]
MYRRRHLTSMRVTASTLVRKTKGAEKWQRKTNRSKKSLAG